MNIEVKGLFKSYGDTSVLNDFCAEFEQNKCTCIMGESGCGKTTLLNILMELQKADSGTVTGVPHKKSAVFQENRLVESLTAIRNVKLASKTKDDSIIERHFTRLNLADSIYAKTADLSGGMKRRVSVIRAILADGEILFLDEPFKGLDEANRKICADYIKENTKNKTVIMVTHDIFEAELMNAKICHMKKQ